MIRCYITDRLRLRGDLAANVARLAGRIDWVQVREKDLPARDLYALVRRLVQQNGPRILVNGRADVALAAGAHGIHLPGNSISPREWRRITPPGFLIGVSCHSLSDLQQAATEGADYAVYSPIFESPGKPGYGPALGLEALKTACQSVAIPILALGGVGERHVDSLQKAGAAGYAAISEFQAESPRS